MSRIVQYNNTTGRVTAYFPSADTPKFEGLPNTLINPDLSAVGSETPDQWIVENDTVRLMTRDESDALIAEREQAIRDLADQLMLGGDVMVRGLIDVLVTKGVITTSEIRAAIKIRANV